MSIEIVPVLPFSEEAEFILVLCAYAELTSSAPFRDLIELTSDVRVWNSSFRFSGNTFIRPVVKTMM